MNLRITNQISSIDSLFRTGEKIGDEEIQAHFAKYLCVKSSGLLENYIKSQVGDYVDACSSKPVAAHVKSKMKTFSNIDYAKLTKFLDSFNPDWTASFAARMNDELKSSLNAVVSNRNNIAHGNQDNISFRNMKNHFEQIKEVIRIIDEIIK